MTILSKLNLDRDGRAITAARFLDSETILSTESSSDEVKFWDLRKMSSFEMVPRSDYLDEKRKLPKFGVREETLFQGSL